MEFARENYSPELIAEMIPLWKDHDKEVPGLKGVTLDPDIGIYEKMAATGSLRIFTVRDMGALHGYQVMMVSRHPHSKNFIQAVQDILYICPALRKGLNGYRFIKWCGEQLKAEGVNAVCQYISAKNDFGRLLERAGYELTDLAFSKRLN